VIRQQFPFPTPPDCVDEDFVYVFNSNNVAILGTSIAAAAEVRDIPLQLEPDAPFLWRGLSVESSNLMIRFKDPAGNFLSNGYAPINLYACPAGISAEQGQPVALEADAGGGQGAIFCPAGSIIQVFFYNNTVGSLTPTPIQLVGVKRFPRSMKRNC